MTMHQLRTAAVRTGSILLTLVLVGSVLAFALIALGPHVFGYRTSTMLTGSMEPGIKPGDVVLTAPRPAEDVKVGDVISYHIPVEDHRVETHRIVEVKHTKGGKIAVRTRGDANDGNDPWVAVLDGDTVWEMQFTVPYVGQVIRALRTPFAQKYLFWGALGLCLVVGMGMIWGRRETEDDYDTALDTIADELDPSYALTFARNWLELAPLRITRTLSAVETRDAEA
ncbi:MAG: signal peptidase I, partial [Nocardioides sp.]|nr:signal peptidase I [Nocardioides sp.]